MTLNRRQCNQSKLASLRPCATTNSGANKINSSCDANVSASQLPRVSRVPRRWKRVAKLVKQIDTVSKSEKGGRRGVAWSGSRARGAELRF